MLNAIKKYWKRAHYASSKSRNGRGPRTKCFTNEPSQLPKMLEALDKKANKLDFGRDRKAVKVKFSSKEPLVREIKTIQTKGERMKQVVLSMKVVVENCNGKKRKKERRQLKKVVTKAIELFNDNIAGPGNSEISTFDKDASDHDLNEYVKQFESWVINVSETQMADLKNNFRKQRQNHLTKSYRQDRLREFRSTEVIYTEEEELHGYGDDSDR